MSDHKYVILDDRGVLAVTGPDAREFLQGLISNDIARVTAGTAMHAAFLTPQGKYLADFFVLQAPGGDENRLMLDCGADRLPDLMKRLKMYKLRAKAEIEDQSDRWSVVALPGRAALDKLGLAPEAGAVTSTGNGLAFADPRLLDLGGRAVLPNEDVAAALADWGFDEGTRADYDRLRIALGVPDGTRDLVVDKSILLEAGFDELNGVDWNKGCYMGQELTARTKYRGLIKKRLMPVAIDGPLPEAGTQVTLDGKDAGEMRSATDTPEGAMGLALIRLEQVEKAEETGSVLEAGKAKLSPRKPDWAAF